MKPPLTLLLCWFSAWSLLGCATVRLSSKDPGKGKEDHAPSVGSPRKIINSSSRKYLDESNAASEIKAFYLQLLESDENTKIQFEHLTKKVSDEYGGIFHTYDPQVIEWFPSENSWNAPEEFDWNGNYLVIQPIGYGRGRRSGYETAIVSEFNVVDSGKAIQENSGTNPADERMSTTMTITFLGFRNFQISPINNKK